MIRLISFFLMICCLVSCSNENGQHKIPVTINGHIITATLRLTPEQKAQGLMGYADLPKDQGMLFVYDTMGKYPFWMKNMRFPIDMIWIGADKSVVDIIANVPACTQDPCPSYMSQEPAQYVLELAAGQAQQLQIHPGTAVEFSLHDK